MNATGHMVQAQMIWNRLTPQARTAVTQALSNNVNPEENNWHTPNFDDAFDAQADYPDDYKSWARRNGVANDEGNLHFTNVAIGPGAAGHPASDGPNGITQWNKQVGILNDSSQQASWGDAMRWVLHLAGDIGAQPLHAINYYSTQFPDGDKGGNEFNVTWNGTGKYDNNLHELWDEGGAHPNSQGTNDPQFPFMRKPLAPQDQQFIEKLASQIDQKYPSSTFTTQQINDTNPQHWVNSLVDEAKDAYQGLTPGETLPDSYLAKVQDTMDKNMALSADRVAGILNKWAATTGAAVAQSAAMVPPHAPTSFLLAPTTISHARH